MDSLKEFFKDKTSRTYPSGQILLYQAEETSNVFYIESGYVKVYDVTANGEEHLMLILGKGDVFPLIWTFRASDTMRYFYEAMTETTLRVARRKQLLDNIDKNHEFTKKLLKYSVETIMQLFLRVECIEASNARRKILQVFDYLLHSHPGKTAKNQTSIAPPLTHQTIANMAGLSRETTSINLKELEKSKIWTPMKHGYVINKSKLSKVLEDSS